MTGPQPPTPPPGDTLPGDTLAAVRAQAAERGMSVSEYVREALWRVRGEEAWERALAQAREEAGLPGEGEIPAPEPPSSAGG